MIIIGVDFHPEFQEIAWVDKDTGSRKSGWRIAKRRRSFTALWRLRARKCVWEWKPAGMRAGLNDCWPSCRLSCESATRPRSAPSAYASRRRIARMRD